MDGIDLGALMGILQQYDPAKNTPLMAVVYDESSPTSESEVAVTSVRLETTVDTNDGEWSRLVFETGVPDS